MNRRRFLQAALPLPVITVAAAAAIAAPTPKDLQMPIKMHTKDGDALIFDCDENGVISINTQAYLDVGKEKGFTYQVMRIQKPQPIPALFQPPESLLTVG